MSGEMEKKNQRKEKYCYAAVENPEVNYIYIYINIWKKKKIKNFHY